MAVLFVCWVSNWCSKLVINNFVKPKILVTSVVILTNSANSYRLILRWYLAYTLLFKDCLFKKKGKINSTSEDANVFFQYSRHKDPFYFQMKLSSQLLVLGGLAWPLSYCGFWNHFLNSNITITASSVQGSRKDPTTKIYCT